MQVEGTKIHIIWEEQQINFRIKKNLKVTLLSPKIIFISRWIDRKKR